MKRPVVFAIECVVAMGIAVLGAWFAAKAGKKINDKANGDVRAGWAQLENARELGRIADVLERAYPPPHADIPKIQGVVLMDADCANPDRIRSLDAETSCAMWGKENPCKPGKHLANNGYGVSCFDDFPNLPKPSLLHRASNIKIIVKPAPEPDPCPQFSATNTCSDLEAKR